MRFTSNIHTHCNWCDGANPPEEIVAEALRLGFTDLGFSSHSTTPFDPTCPGVPDENAYRADIRRLQVQYENDLHILCGIEQDYYAPVERCNYDYVIGSVHYLRMQDGSFLSVDRSLTHTMEGLTRYYGGDAFALLRDYYQLMADSAARYRPDVIGHFDLIVKHNIQGQWFDEAAPAYQKLALEALDRVLDTLRAYGGLLEVNTGAMSRGLRPSPYPSAFLLRHAAMRGARVILTSDSHAKQTLHAFFDDALTLLQSCGFHSMVVLHDGVFVDIMI